MMSGSRLEMAEVCSNRGGRETLLIGSVYLEVKHYFFFSFERRAQISPRGREGAGQYIAGAILSATSVKVFV